MLYVWVSFGVDDAAQEAAPVIDVDLVRLTGDLLVEIDPGL